MAKASENLPAGKAGLKVKSQKSKIKKEIAVKSRLTFLQKITLLSRLKSVKSYRPKKRDFLILLLVGLLLLAFYKKNWFVAALVNGQPITTLEVMQRLNANFKGQTLNQMINEKILAQEALKKGIVISQTQLDQKVAEAENSYGGKEAFEMLLSQQGISKDEFIKQTHLQLMAEKLYAGEINPSEDEIKKFMEDNKSSPEATDEAKFRTTAEQSIKQQKLQQVFGQKFQELKERSSIQIF